MPYDNLQRNRRRLSVMVNPDTLGICRAVHRVYRMEVGSNISFAKFTEHVLRLYMFKVE